MLNPAIATVVYPARNFEASVKAWATVFGAGPTFSSDGVEKAPGEADFAVFKTDDVEIGLTSLPWVDEPLVMFDTDDVTESRRALVDDGATGLGEIADGSLAPLGTAPITNGDPETGIVDVPGARLAVVQLTDGSKLGLRQSLPVDW
ncbi:VOC family protein [Actinomadura sp. 7K507]|uniref:VOC family protein n=1 Tax=Actinomadura sp. 7K507 TaxID=2530365 RepID=UPI00104E29EB|nr:VOC family protein [Actinomadura sp. 7K507]TDC75382.1 VOC family protein [Actinomadura sp. 7K507]